MPSYYRKQLYQITLDNELITQTNVITLKGRELSKSVYHFVNWGLIKGEIFTLSESLNSADFLYSTSARFLSAKGKQLFLKFHNEFHVNVP
jgi:hypothetical protein